MMKTLVAFGLILLLVACSGRIIPLSFVTPVASPSALPAIFSPTPRFIPSPTATGTPLVVPPTLTETISITPVVTITPPQPSSLVVDILGCDTSLDILHQMGEVTNAYPVIRNYTGRYLTNVCATLSASDEARVHPDKTACSAALPAGNQVTFKLTVDTGTGQDTAIQVDASTNEGDQATASRSSCKALGLPGWLSEKVGLIEPIP
jgi:hypothetical protein